MSNRCNKSHYHQKLSRYCSQTHSSYGVFSDFYIWIIEWSAIDPVSNGQDIRAYCAIQMFSGKWLTSEVALIYCLNCWLKESGWRSKFWTNLWAFLRSCARNRRAARAWNSPWNKRRCRRLYPGPFRKYNSNQFRNTNHVSPMVI